MESSSRIRRSAAADNLDRLRTRGSLEALAGGLADIGAFAALRRDWSAAAVLLAAAHALLSGQGGTFTLTKNGPAMVNGQYVAQPVSFAATRDGREPLDMAGVDVFRVEDGLIKEVWLYSSDQAVEDAFWA